MTIGADGWLSLTVHHPGVPGKFFPELNSGANGLALHSMESSVADAEARFSGPDQVSVMFENPKVGPLIQCYPITASTWTSGCYTANTTTWAIESEGHAGEALTDSQIANVMQVVEEWEAHFGKRMARQPLLGRGKNFIWEHREIYNWDPDNAGSTSCPSGRYARFYEALAFRNAALDMPQEPQMTQPTLSDLANRVTTLNKETVRRFTLIAIASDPDSSKVDAAIAALQAVGLVDKTL